MNERKSRWSCKRKRLDVADLNWHWSSSPRDIFPQLSTELPKKAVRSESSQCWHPRLTATSCQNLGGISINTGRWSWVEINNWESIQVLSPEAGHSSREKGGRKIFNSYPTCKPRQYWDPESVPTGKLGWQEGREYSPLYVCVCVGGQFCRKSTLPSCWPIVLPLSFQEGIGQRTWNGGKNLRSFLYL